MSRAKARFFSLALVVMALGATGCAHQREPVFAGQSRGFFGWKPNFGGGNTALAEPPLEQKKVSSKSDRVDQSARRMPGFDGEEPFDFDQVR